jgi:peptidyl-prolyl cis-trans isomerase A (cyclophilin A)
MKRFFFALSIVATSSLSAQGKIPIVIETSAGKIEAELDSAHAPITVTNFLRYMDAHLLDNGAFFRAVTMTNQPNTAVKIEVIQSRAAAAQDGREFPAIPLERTNVTGLKHHDGTLSMARNIPNSATNQFFVTIGEQPELDFGGKRNADGQGFAAFGHVTKGMDVVRKIQSGAVNGQNLLTPVTIIRVARR